jgi:hypothetical protein
MKETFRVSKINMEKIITELEEALIDHVHTPTHVPGLIYYYHGTI